MILPQIYVFDNRGQGLSIDSDPSLLTIQSMAASTVDFIRALKLKTKPDIYGYSLGGFVTLTLLTQNGDAVRRAVSQAGSPGGNITYTPQVSNECCLVLGGMLPTMFSARSEPRLQPTTRSV